MDAYVAIAGAVRSCTILIGAAVAAVVACVNIASARAQVAADKYTSYCCCILLDRSIGDIKLLLLLLLQMLLQLLLLLVYVELARAGAVVDANVAADVIAA